MIRFSFKLACLLTVTLITELFGAVYYVTVDGDDGNTGTTKETAWEHCPGMQGWSGTRNLQAGDTVFFKGGDTWEVFGGAAVLQVTGGVVYDGRAWGGMRAVFRAGADLSRSVIAILNDHVNLPTVVQGFEADAGGTITSGIGINHPQMERPLVGAVKRISDCLVHDVKSYSAQNTYKYGIVISNWSGKYHVKNVEVLHCKVYNISRGGINLYPGNDIPENRVENVLVRGNEIWNTGMDPDYAGSCLAIKNHVVNAVVEYNHVHDPVNGIGIGVSTHPVEGFIGPENVIIRHNIIANSKHAGMYITSWGPVSVAIYGNIITNSTYHAINLTDKLLDSISIRIYNNTMVNNYSGSRWAEQIRISCGKSIVSTLEVRNNIIYTTDSTRALLDDFGLLTAHSNNLYYKPIGGTLAISKGTTFTASDITTWEPTGQVADPLLQAADTFPTGFTGTYGVDLQPEKGILSLLENSPCIDNGAVLDSRYTSSINSVSRPNNTGWDIGAYEWRSKVSVSWGRDAPVKPAGLVQVVPVPGGFAFVGNLPITHGVIGIYTLKGECIRELPIRAAYGNTLAYWDSLNSRGRRCLPGCYLGRVKTTAGVVVGQFLIHRAGTLQPKPLSIPNQPDR